MKGTALKHLEKPGKTGRSSLTPKQVKITVGFASCGVAAGAQAVLNAFTAGIKKRNNGCPDTKDRM